MPSYKCTAYDSKGAEKREQIEAASEAEAIEKLRKRHLTVVEVSEVTNGILNTDNAPEKVNTPSLGKVPTKVVLSFYEQLAFLIKAGIPIYSAVRMLANTFHNKNLDKILKDVLFVLSEGSPLSTALLKYPDSFPPFHAHLISVGEKSGNLDQALTYLIDMVKEEQEIRENLIKAAAYPIFLLVLSFSLVAGLLLFIFPKFQEIFTSFGVKLPPLTAFFIAASESLRGNFTLYTAVTISAIAGIGYFFTSQAMSGTRDRLFLSVPVVKDVFVSMFIATFSNTLGNLLKAGVPLLESLVICQQTIRGELKSNFFDKVIGVVRDGEPTSKGMEGSELIPEMAHQLMIVAESTGQIDLMMENVFRFYKKRYRETLNTVTAIAQPLLMFLAAGLIAMVAISLFVPLFKLSSSMREQ